MMLTITIARSELDRLAGLEPQLHELSLTVKEFNAFKKFTPQPGNLVQFINLLSQSGAVYEVANS